MKNQKHASLALRPFTCGNYSIYKGRNYYNLDRVETLKSFYGIGEDLDKYMAASLALELTEKIVPEEVPQPRIFALLLDFLNEMELRKQKHTTLLLAFETKLLFALGNLLRRHEDKCSTSFFSTVKIPVFLSYVNTSPGLSAYTHFPLIEDRKSVV